MRQIYAYPSDEIGWRKDEQGTRLVDSLYHVLARKKCILCSVWLRHKNYFTSIPYIAPPFEWKLHLLGTEHLLGPVYMEVEDPR